MNNPLSAAVAKIVQDRFLLTPGQAGFPEGVLLASCGGPMGNDTCYVRIAVTAAGMQPSEIGRIHELLVDRLRGALLPTVPGDIDLDPNELTEADGENQNPWVHMICIQPNLNTQEPEVVVTINDPGFMGNASTSAVMNIVAGILAPVARENFRSLIVLTGNQRYVPLDFEVDDTFRRSMTLELPASLKFIRPRLASVEYHEDPEVCAASYLAMMLKLALDRYEFVQNVWVRPSPNGVKIDVNFGGRNYPSARDLNIVQVIVTQTVRRHAFLDTGFFTNLVLSPAHVHFDEVDDFDEDRGFLGEFAEY